ncbi:unnamed protein product [Closterium sp. NIES-54]
MGASNVACTRSDAAKCPRGHREGRRGGMGGGWGRGGEGEEQGGGGQALKVLERSQGWQPSGKSRRGATCD